MLRGQRLFEHVLVTGGAGYVGSALVPRLLDAGYRVTVMDLYLYGRDVFRAYRGDRLREVEGDVRDAKLVRQALGGADALVHLACISNDPSYDLDPRLGKSINFDAFEPLLQSATEAGVRRFVYASSSSVYGLRDEPDITEALEPKPLTDYSRYKALCEDILHDRRSDGLTAVTVRPATVCGYAARLRLDLTVNIFTNHAISKNLITVFGGEQLRPNIHIDDMVDFYLYLLEQPASRIDDEIFNVGSDNLSLIEIAETVRDTLDADVGIRVTASEDRRSYRVSSAKARTKLGFSPTRSIADAVRDLQGAFRAGKVPNSLEDPRYFNIKRMQEARLH